MGDGIIEARWDGRAKAWIVKVPSFGPTTLSDTLASDSSESDLLAGVRRKFGLQNTKGMQVLKVTTDPLHRGTQPPHPARS